MSSPKGMWKQTSLVCFGVKNLLRRRKVFAPPTRRGGDSELIVNLASNSFQRRPPAFFSALILGQKKLFLLNVQKVLVNVMKKL